MDLKHICSQCLQVYCHAASLRRHVKITHQNRRYQCTHCTKSYKRVEHLCVHMKHHTNETNLVPVENNATTAAVLGTDLLATPHVQEYMETTAQYVGEPTPNTRNTNTVAGTMAAKPPHDFDDIPTTLGFKDLLRLDESLYRTDTEDEDISRELLEGAAAFLEEAAKEAQLERNLDALPSTNKILYKNWETPRDIASHDKLYNHHKVLIFACYKLYKHVDHISRKQ